jgi:hypothetical protein
MMPSELYCSRSIVIRRVPADVYDMVADVTRMGEWSPTCTGCWWDDGDGPWHGSWFTGRNERLGREWQTRSLVQVADRGREFAFVVGGTGVRWGYAFDPVGSWTNVTESWQMLTDGITTFKAKYGEEAASMIADRRDVALWGIPITLAAIKAAAEAVHPVTMEREDRR